MIYLVQLDNAYKIGYAKNIDKRIKNLSSTHIIVNLIDSKEGTYKDEKELHRLCDNFRIKNELFKIEEKVVDLFKNYIPCSEEIKKIDSNNKVNINDIILPKSYYGILTISDEELSKEINLSVKTIKRLNKSLMNKGYLEIQNGIKIFKNL